MISHHNSFSMTDKGQQPIKNFDDKKLHLQANGVYYLIN